jgi:two-component system, OmpR family, alkaline phosphatase synthesis response regulator PhoP
MKKTKTTVMIIDDDVSLVNVLQDKLFSEGYLVLTAQNGQEGFSLSIKHHPDIILLDILMPKMNGVEMLKKLRADNWGKNVPILLLTNDSNPEHMEETLKLNANDYLIKSDWKLEDVLVKIKETIGI